MFGTSGSELRCRQTTDALRHLAQKLLGAQRRRYSRWRASSPSHAEIRCLALFFSNSLET